MWEGIALRYANRKQQAQNLTCGSRTDDALIGRASAYSSSA
jgi:hypothetical protein